MPVHDWTKVDAGVFHDFHCAWIIHIKEALNAGLLPDGYYAMAEQHARDRIADVLTLHVPSPNLPTAGPARSRGIAIADAPPRVGRKLVADPAATYQARRRTVATVRHRSPASWTRLIRHWEGTSTSSSPTCFRPESMIRAACMERSGPVTTWSRMSFLQKSR